MRKISAMFLLSAALFTNPVKAEMPKEWISVYKHIFGSIWIHENVRGVGKYKQFTVFVWSNLDKASVTMLVEADCARKLQRTLQLESRKEGGPVETETLTDNWEFFELDKEADQKIYSFVCGK